MPYVHIIVSLWLFVRFVWRQYEKTSGEVFHVIVSLHMTAQFCFCLCYGFGIVKVNEGLLYQPLQMTIK